MDTCFKYLNRWHRRFLNLAQHVSTWSKDPSTKCGAVITRGNRIISLGFNGFPMGTNDDADIYNDRNVKYDRIIHAEINAILFSNEPLSGATLYTCPLPPCVRCATQVIQSGISTIVAPTPSGDLNDRWKKSLESAAQLYVEAGLELITVIPNPNETHAAWIKSIQESNET